MPYLISIHDRNLPCRSESKAAEEMICLKLRDSITQAADTSKPLHNESEDNNMGLAEEFPRRPPVTSIVMKKVTLKEVKFDVQF